MAKRAKDLNPFSMQLKQRFASEVLWHFVSREKSDEKSYRILLSILKTGLRAQPQKERVKITHPLSSKKKSSYGHTVTCLADIPLKDLHVHAERYGRFAIGFHKTSAIRSGFTPVLYVNQDSPIFGKFTEMRDKMSAELAKENHALRSTFDKMLYALGAILKPCNFLSLPRRSSRLDRLLLNNFYYEREWRSVQDWNFSSEDVALILLPKGNLKRFARDRKKAGLRASDTTPVLPFDLIYEV